MSQRSARGSWRRTRGCGPRYSQTLDVQIFLLTVKIFFQVIELESEMVGARLDNVYLDKELAGRIQQIQLLLAANTPADVKEKMWTQIESEMCLQRSKTIAQMCRTKQVG